MPYDDLPDLLAPLPSTGIELGRNITANNPDVEVLAMTMNEIPLTASAFGDMSRGKNWFLMDVMMVESGKAGFSSVPYSKTTSGKKDTTTKQPLYVNEDDGSTTIYTFEKTSNNKERGKRVETIEDEEGVKNMTSKILPGMAMKFFLSDDDYEKGFFGPDVSQGGESGRLPPFSLVWLQVSSVNGENCNKGSGLKIKKMIPLDTGKTTAAMATVMKALPDSPQAFEKVYQKAKEMVSVQRLLCEPKSKLYKVTPSKAEVRLDIEKNHAYILNASEELTDVFVDTKLIDNATGCVDTSMAFRFLNLALASKAVTLVIKHNMQDGVVFDDGPVNSVVHMHINLNQMFSLKQLKDYLETACSVVKEEGLYFDTADNLTIHCDTHQLRWTNSEHTIRVNNQPRVLYFQLSHSAMEEANEDSPLPSHFISQGYSGNYLKLSVHLTENSESELIDSGEGKTRVMDLELREDLRSTIASSGTKRKLARISMF